MEHLGKQSQEPISKLDTIPWEGHGEMEVTLECHEFTSHCPVTRQPDFGKLTITYQPAASLVETKSLKLWLWQWRGEACFNETIVDVICDQFEEQVEPRWVEVRGSFARRGGIKVTAVSKRS